jgi:UDP-2-acetamido-3-amino-2,3-dideoxy-glucuronate N-acetyltransferase
VTAPFVHPTAEVDETASVGPGCFVWNWTRIREGATIGAGTKIGQGVYVDHGVALGEGCKVQNGVSVFAGVTCGDFVFLGPHVTFTNDLYPRAAAGDEWTLVPTTIEDHVSVGANATIICGVVLGRGCMVGAGSVVTSDVPPWALVVGTPARRIGWVDLAGRRVAQSPGSGGPADG